MQVSEILKVKGNALFTIAPEGKLTDAVSVMAQHNMGSLVVIDKGRLVEMLTFEEVLTALDKGRGALGDARVRDIMEHDPVTASPAMEVNDLRRTMIDSGARYSGDGPRQAARVISFRDVAKAVLEEQDFENRMLKAISRTGPSSLEACESPYRTHRLLDPRCICRVRRLVHDGDARCAPPGSAAGARHRGPGAPREPQGARRRRGERRAQRRASRSARTFARHIEATLSGLGYAVSRQEFDTEGVKVRNLEVRRAGAVRERRGSS